MHCDNPLVFNLRLSKLTAPEELGFLNFQFPLRLNLLVRSDLPISTTNSLPDSDLS